MDIERLPDSDACAAAAADLIADAVRGGARHLVLAGGTTPIAAYTLLRERDDVDWDGVHLWYGDERCVPPGHEDSNHRAVAEALGEAPGATWHRMRGEFGPDAGAAAYARELDAAGVGLGGTAFDLVLNGMGTDGHTASLFPDHAVLDSGGQTAGIGDAHKPPPERITLTLPALNCGARLVLMVTGAFKAKALAQVIAGPDRGTPASLLAREKLLVLADAKALPEG